jgi:hypothetical protein
MQQDPNLWQVLAWQTAIFGGIIALIQLFFSWRRDRRERRRNQIELSHQLIDSVFDDERASKILNDIDTVHRAKRNRGKQVFDAHLTLFQNALESGPNPKDGTIEAIQLDLDCLLYYLNRIELSLQAGMLCFSDVRHPLEYYISTLSPFKKPFEEYCRFSGYRHAVSFLKRFQVWNSA